METDATKHILFACIITVITGLLARRMQKSPEGHKVTGYTPSRNDTFRLTKAE